MMAQWWPIGFGALVQLCLWYCHLVLFACITPETESNFEVEEAEPSPVTAKSRKALFSLLYIAQAMDASCAVCETNAI
ncbi:hypothetical protein HBH56_232310 [Parastagonospora nodorum]|nr:hypothetical protein HBH56_232310 [Parastagonospora nodorum]KAH4147747.1 hypothetical protein HBH44_219380 [Parastagonospora nodorum]KAH4181686.1 hypothetical protein HBH42_233000 [Parastagonospora nodorum]KAH4285303.1 hypothetical protein HBI02_233220 [Parastagonospora nodorum]KAH4286235.1 hypothetical protein HBI01_241080 [Parastagonospora nodorum]